MSGAGLVLAVVGVVLALAAGAVATPSDRVAEARPVRALPAAHGAPVGLWRHLVGRELRRVGWRGLLVLPALLLYVAAGVARLAAIVVRLTDLGIERVARAADAATDLDYAHPDNPTEF